MSDVRCAAPGCDNPIDEFMAAGLCAEHIGQVSRVRFHEVCVDEWFRLGLLP